MAWSNWPLIVVALLVGAAAGWAVRGRRNAALAGTTGDGTPVVATESVVPEPTDTDRPTSTEPTPAAADDTGGRDNKTPTPEASAEHTAGAESPVGDHPDRAPTEDSAPVPEHVPAADTSQPEPAPIDTATPEPASTDTATPEPALAEAATPESTALDPRPDVKPVAPTPVAAESVPAEPDAPDDFRRIQGIGPKMAAALQAAGIRTFRQLAELDEPALRETIRAAGLRGAPSLATWPQQAKALADAPDPASGDSADA